jgi:hypothetical protein
MIGLLSTAPAWAGWQGVFQVCCHSCSTPAVSGYYAGYGCCDPCCQPCCPQTVCQTNYVQRCYYQPVTTYRTQTYYQPVTTYRTSYYYEPVTCYRYSCCYDPCTCSYRQVATPYTSYRLRSQCCPVTSFVQRCCMVPVTTYQKCCYWEAQTCCSLVDPCAGVAAPATAAPAVPAVTESPSGVTVPGVRESAPAVPPANSGSPLYDRTQPPAALPPEGSSSSFRQGSPRSPATPAVRPPVVPKYDRIAFDRAPSFNWNLAGQIVSQSNSPRSGAKLLFVSDAASGTQESATADRDGRFRLTLASGNWLVYVRDEQGKAVFHTKVNVKGHEAQQMTLVSR